MKIRPLLLVLGVLPLLFACSTKPKVEGLWGASVSFSPHETQQLGLVLRSDSTFLYFSRPNLSEPWELQSGSWSWRAGKVHISSEGLFNLWLNPGRNSLEILDYEGNAVISGRPLKLQRVSGAPWSNELSVVLTGKLLQIGGQYAFMPCNSFSIIRLIELSDDKLSFLNQVVTIRLSFVPKELEDMKEFGLRLESLFGPATCP